MDIRIKKLHDLWVHFKFETLEFDFLFSENEEIVKLRESMLPDFFSDLNNLYWEHILITIARLLDPYEQGQNLNLSLFVLPAILKEKGITQSEDIRQEIESLKGKYKSIIFYRKKHLAHYDETYSTGNREFNTSTHFNDVTSFLDAMLELINKTLDFLNLPRESGLVMYPAHHCGARELINILKSEMKLRNTEDF